MKILMHKKDGVLTPDPVDEEEFNKLKDQIYMIEIKKKRNLKHHRKLFGIIRIFLKNQDKFQTEKEVLNALKYQLGYYSIVEFNGFRFPLLHSISFEKMDQLEFDKFYKSAVNLLAKELGMSVIDLEDAYLQETERFIDDLDNATIGVFDIENKEEDNDDTQNELFEQD